jgi:hypothetical protein
VMAAPDAKQLPAVPFDEANEFPAGKSLHTAISRIRSFPPG